MLSRILFAANRIPINCIPTQIRSMSVRATFLECNEFGPPEKVLQLRSAELRSPADDEVLVKTLLAPINPAHINLIQGLSEPSFPFRSDPKYKYSLELSTGKYGISASLPFIPGNECVAEVIECGKAVSSIRVGDRIIPSETDAGTWTTHKLFKAHEVFKVPADIPNVEAATISVNPSTAFRMLRDFVPLKPGDTVIQNGANSAVGQAVIQLCKIWNINSVNVVRNRPNINELKESLKALGATEVLTEEEIRVTTLFKTKKLPAPKLAFNCVGGKSATNIMRYLTDQGQLISYGAMSREPLTIPTGALIFKDIAFRGFWMTAWRNKHSEAEIAGMFNELFQLIADGKFKAAPHKLVSIDQYEKAMVELTDLKGMVGRKILFNFV